MVGLSAAFARPESSPAPAIAAVAPTSFIAVRRSMISSLHLKVVTDDRAPGCEQASQRGRLSSTAVAMYDVAYWKRRSSRRPGRLGAGRCLEHARPWWDQRRTRPTDCDRTRWR